MIIGGCTSIGGAIVGGLIVGAAENLAEVYIGPLIGGGITPWLAYVLALAFRISVAGCSRSAPLSESENHVDPRCSRNRPCVDPRRYPLGLLGLLALAFIVVPLWGKIIGE